MSAVEAMDVVSPPQSQDDGPSFTTQVKNPRKSRSRTPNKKKAKVASISQLTPKLSSGVGKKTTPKKATPKKTKRSRKIIKTKKVMTKTTKTVKRTTITQTETRILTTENKVKINKKNFFAWKDDEFVIDILQRRGWNYLGEPIEDGREDYPHSMYEAKEAGLISKEPCLYWADDDDSRVLQGFSQDHIISSLPNADKALTKNYQQALFDEYDWFPKCFTLPKERQLLIDYVQANPESYWIAKPRDSYGGFGMCVFKALSEEFMHMIDRRTTFVAQKYMQNPYLFAGKYKFHLRAYMVVTHAYNPLRAYLWKNAQIQFSTHPFDLSQIENNFNKYSHITNYKVNNEKKNRKYLIEDKAGIGMGSEWGVAKFFEHMNKHAPNFNEEKFWDDLTNIAKVVSYKLTSSRKVSKSFKQGKAYPTNHFEIYGLDIIMDEHCNLALTEANTQPGLDFTDPVMPNGIFNPEIVRANDITAGIVNDSITLLGLDEGRKLFSPFIDLHS